MSTTAPTPEGAQNGQAAYLHRATSRRRKNAAEPAPHSYFAEKLIADAAAAWERWRPWYGPLDAALVGTASRKSVEQKLGLQAVCLSHALRTATRPGADWTVKLTTDDAGAPLALMMHRDGDALAVPVEVARRRVTVGARRVFVGSPTAALDVLRALAAEAAAFFGAPTRRAV